MVKAPPMLLSEMHGVWVKRSQRNRKNPQRMPGKRAKGVGKPRVDIGNAPACV